MLSIIYISLQSHQSLKYTIVLIMLLKVIMWHYTVMQLVILHLKWRGSGLEKFWWNPVLILYQLSTEISQECTSVWHGMELATIILLIVQFTLNVSKFYISIFNLPSMRVHWFFTNINTCFTNPNNNTLLVNWSDEILNRSFFHVACVAALSFPFPGTNIEQVSEEAGLGWAKNAEKLGGMSKEGEGVGKRNHL